MTEAVVSEIGDAAGRAAAFAIRHAVFCVEQGVSKEEEYDGLDGSCRHYLASLDGQPVGTARTRPLPDGAVKIERVAVLRPHRGTGIGRALMRRVMDDIAAAGTPMVLNAQLASQAFYAGLGFTPEGEVFEEAGIPHIRMVRRAA